jgi:hypothetical protein
MPGLNQHIFCLAFFFFFFNVSSSLAAGVYAMAARELATRLLHPAAHRYTLGFCRQAEIRGERITSKDQIKPRVEEEEEDDDDDDADDYDEEEGGRKRLNEDRSERLDPADTVAELKGN